MAAITKAPYRATPIGSEPRSLEDWNQERQQFWQDIRRFAMEPSRYPNGLTCPNCNGMLHDTGQAMQTSPTLLRVKCGQCGFKGERYE